MSLGAVLSCTPHVVENIFQHLTAKELSNCASVCKLWEVISQEEIQRRKEVVPFFQGIKCGKHRRIHRIFEPCSLKQVSKFENQLKAQLENVRIKPASCIAFATTSFLKHFVELFTTYFATKRPRKRLKRCYLDYFDTAVKIALQNNLPASCCITLYVEDNIAFYNGDLQSVLETNAPAICGYLFPKFLDESLRFYKRKEHTGKILKKIIMDGQSIKSSLNLVEYSSYPYFQIALNELRHRHNAFETGIIMPVQIASNYVPVFEGPKVQVFRFSIARWNMEQDTLDVRMNKWKQLMDEKKGLNENTISFIFSVDHDDCSMVCEIFKEVFPYVPLVVLYRYVPFNLNAAFLRDCCETLINRSLLESGLKYCSVVIFVTFMV